MDTISIEILNPKAKRLLEDMADMELIVIRDVPEKTLSQMLEKFRFKETEKEKKISLINQASIDPLFMADVKEINDDFSVIDQENI